MKVIHFVGIGGISMSGLASVSHRQGNQVSGSDLTENDQIAELRKVGIKIYIGHDAENLPKNCTHVVVNGAISNDNPEIIEAKKRGIEIIDRSILLAEVSRQYKNIIAIAGTSGKSSTTAMIGAIFQEAGLFPTIHNGASCVGCPNSLGLMQGNNEYFITEACEFKRSFLTLAPTIAIITNINPDHMDCYTDLNDLKETFTNFAQKSSLMSFINVDCKNSKEISTKIAKYKTYGIKNKADIMATNIHEYEKGKYKFKVIANSTNFSVQFNVYGYHNIYNALSAIGVALENGIPIKAITNALLNYKGISRRFEEVSKIGGTKILSDYAHHPFEIATTIKTANSLFDNFLIIFQPHTYSRTKALFDDFKNVFKDCNVVFYETYSAREKPIKGGSAQDLANALGKKCFLNKNELIDYTKNIVKDYEALIFVGAGDIDTIARYFA